MANQRKTDGLWFKIAAWLGVSLLALGVYVYQNDKNDNRENWRQTISILQGQSSTLNHWINEVKMSNMKYEEGQKKIDKLSDQLIATNNNVSNLSDNVKDLCHAFKQYSQDKGYPNHGCRK